eukprot:gi/632948235/ref/XP_007889479.1/ PREDICTED: uncharacterized protein LOC103177212 isoform X2 [Callorhinchus milii]
MKTVKHCRGKPYGVYSSLVPGQPEIPCQCPFEKQQKTPGGLAFWNPYETTFERAFPFRPGSAAHNLRPSSSNGYTYPYHLGEPIGNTLYNIDYCWKPYSKQKAIRSGSSSGFRRNNPHPSQAFLIWRLAPKERQIPYTSQSDYGVRPRSQEDICRTISAQYRSIYQQDYLGMPQGFQMKYAMPRPSNIKLENPCPPLIDPECRRKPKESSDHTVCSSRYSSNKRWDIPAQGIDQNVLLPFLKAMNLGHCKNNNQRTQPNVLPANTTDRERLSNRSKTN